MTLPVVAAVLEAVDGASWVSYDAPRRRFLVWRGAPQVEVYETATGAMLGQWPIHADIVDLGAAQTAVAERVRAGY